MFVLTTKSTVADKAIAALVATAMVLWGVGAHLTAEAASLIEVSDLLSDSAPGVVSNHTIDFEIPTGSLGVDADTDSIQITFPAGFSLIGLVAVDIDLELNGVDEDLSTDWAFSTSSQVITLTSTGGRATPGDVLTVKVGTNTNGGGAGVRQITNNAATGTYAIGVQVRNVGATVQDSADTRIYIVDNVVVSADVDTIFNFYITGLPIGYIVNGETTTQTGTTTTVPFGTLAPGVAKIVGQQLRVVTNAIGGYTVTVETDQQLTSDTGADIDSFSDGTNVTSGAAGSWSAPAGTINSNDTYGHWGMTAEDPTLSGGDQFGASLYSAVLTTPQEVMYHNGVTDGIVANQGSSTIAYKAEIMSFQEAADDYTATLTYIATPTF